MAGEGLDARLARLAEARDAADRRYNAALTALDQALLAPVELPHPPPSYDASHLAALDRTWDLLPGGAPTADRSLKGRLRGFIWRLVGPSLLRQRDFNAALVAHFHHNVAAHEEAAKAHAATIALARDLIAGVHRFQSHLIQYLQTITLYVDTRDRSVGGDIQVLNEGLGAVVDDWLKRWESLAARDAHDAGRLEAIAATVSELRDMAGLAEQGALALKREVERLLARGGAPVAAERDARAAAPRVDLESFKYVGFEDRFRGSREQITARLEDYLPRFEGQTDVLDVGCGRGEFLELLGARGIPARGLDLNHDMVEVCRTKGLDVVERDALSYLETLPDASLGGLLAVQVVEHLEPPYLIRVIETAAHKLRPDAVLIVETINPACWSAFFDSYIRDFTHVRPWHPETLQYLLRASGFRSVEIEYRSPFPEAERLASLPIPGPEAHATAHLVDVLNDHASKLNGRLFTHMDYAAVARR